MGDMGDFWRDVKAAGQERRANNRTNGAATLKAKGIEFTEKNGGAHLIVKAGERTVDYWPGTGLWVVRGQPASRYGLRGLIQFCKPAGESSSERGAAPSRASDSPSVAASE